MRVVLGLAMAALAWAQGDCKPQSPCYSPESIVNSAHSEAGLAPYTFASIYGTNLSYSSSGLSGAAQPYLDGVGVMVNGIQALMLYVSPGQVNVILPQLRAAEATLQLTRPGQVGPAIKIKLSWYAPALFASDGRTVVAVRPDWSLITREAPAHGGELVILYAAGLGQTVPSIAYGDVAMTAAPIEAFDQFQIFLDGAPIERELILYAGIAPGFPALYQINFRLPRNTGRDPEIRIAVWGQMSPPGMQLPVTEN